MSRRLLATLSSLPSSSPAPSPPLAPPYAHSAQPRATPSLRPPYAHSLPSAARAGPSRINAPHRFSLPPAVEGGERGGAGEAEGWAVWAREMLDARREEVRRVWEETLEGLDKARMNRASIPEISYSTLSERLSIPSTVEDIKNSGSVVVRDVIPDSVALGWARKISAAMERRHGDAVYWHPVLLAARSHTSILNTSSVVLAALTGTDGDEAWILAESVREGLGSDAVSAEGRWAIGDIGDAWAVHFSSTGPSTPLLSHLALSPPSAPIPLSSTIHSATYSLLRPLFRPVRSRISFYSSTEYLRSANWTLVDPPDITPTPSTTSPAEYMPHLNALPTAPINLNPGDMILRHPLLPVSPPTSDPAGQAFLPLSLLPQTEGNAVYVHAQKKAFEAGLPTPLAVRRRGMWGERGAVRVEETHLGDLQGRGRRVMGY